MAGTITSALAPEEKTILENVISLLNQLASMQEGETAAVEASEESPSEEMDMEEVDVEKASDGNTGQGDAETRLDEQTGTTDQSLADLKKSIESLNTALKSRVVKKSKSTNPVMGYLQKLEKSLKEVVKQQEAQSKLNVQLFDALGFTDDVINKALEEKEIEKVKPVQSTDTNAVVKEILVEVFKQIPSLNQNPEYRHPFNQKKGTQVNKNMVGLLHHIHNGAGQATKK